jgi:hypothetical protein
MAALAELNITALNFTRNCTAVGTLFGNASKEDHNDGLFGPEFLQLVLPEEYRDNVTTSDLQDYIDNVLFRPDGNFSESGIVEEARHRCWKEICQAAYEKYRGNPDIAGIGVRSVLSTDFMVTVLTGQDDDRLRDANCALHPRYHYPPNYRLEARPE